jgi:hypothetical protein
MKRVMHESSVFRIRLSRPAQWADTLIRLALTGRDKVRMPAHTDLLCLEGANA